jgi:outer membrane receptor protein involved in Fe transport
MNSRLRLLIGIVCFGLISSFAQAQTFKLTGKVTNDKNEPLPGVSVKIIGGGGVSTDIEGRFSLNLSTGKKYELNFTGVGYETKTVTDVEVVNGQANEVNIVMAVKAKSEENVVVTAKRSSARLETVASIISFQKNTNTVASVISAESIRRSPDKNTGEVLKRTPGASIQEGRFIVVRGLADRYNQAMINGILLTSTEPDRKTFSFDLIPAPMIDNIIINKAFVPEYPGEWAGGLIQVNTRDIPSKGFFNVQIGTGFNTQTTGKKFFKDNHGGKTDWLGIEDGTRELPSAYTTKSGFDTLSPAQKTAIGKQLRNAWSPKEYSAPLNVSFQANGGFNTKIFKKILGGTFGVVYNKTNKYIKQLNRSNSLSNNIFSTNIDLNDDRYVQDISWGALGSLTMQINPLNKISVKSIFNVNSPSSITQRTGNDFSRNDELKGSEITFKENIFFNGQVTGEHKIVKPLTLKWYGSFNILDGYIPDQLRILYSRTANTTDPYRAILSNSLSQQSGSRIFQNLSDYIYTAGGDLSYTFNWLSQKQTIKSGYMLQIKDRLYDARLFANYLPKDNDVLRQLPADKIFATENFGDGNANSTQFAFDAIKGNTFRYMANTILNAGFLQFDNQFSKVIRVVWGVRVEDYDQLVGSVKVWDPRHSHTEVRDYLPGLNATFRINNKTNIRLSGSQTVIRPELRELSFLNLYDFELNASVQGNPLLKRTKVSNGDIRFELYPRAGEVFTAGLFYKYFNKPIEQIFNEGSGGASTFNYQNVEKATAYGAEVELRKKLDFITGGLKNFTFQANAAYIYSRVTDPGLKVDRSLQGQSPYLFNVGLLYDLEKQGLSATVLFNEIGERIYLVGDVSAAGGSPDIYEAPRPLLDFQLSKKLIQNRAEVRLNVSDILNTTQYFYQNAGGKTTFQKGSDAYRFTRKFGTTFSLTFNYSFVKS